MQQSSIHRAAAKSKERLRLNSLKVLHFDSRDRILINNALHQINLFTSGMQFEFKLTYEIVMAALESAHRASDEYYTLRHAQAWNTDFIIPQAAIDDDSALFRQCSYDFTQMCKIKQTRLAYNRISVQRIDTIFGQRGDKIPGVDQRDIVILKEFADIGITPPVSTNFKPESLNLPPLRDRYIKLHHTIDKLLYKQYMDGTMILLQLKEAQRISGLHISPQHHADSKGKQEGRCIGDLSGQHDPSYTPLNGSATKKDQLRDLINLKWGDIKHPTVDMLVKMVLTSADLHGWDNIVLWKKDLKGAFNLLNYNPSCCKLFAFLLLNDIVVIHLAGLFGWIGMPHAFQVLTRLLHALCRHIISGLCYWYVDDLMAVSHKNLYVNDSTLVDTNVQQLLGNGSIALAKSQYGRLLEFLGWEFNLDTQSITLCARNMNKLVHALFSFDTEQKISISHIQRLASLLSRTSLLSRHMRPYTHILHIITSGYDQPHVRIQLSVLAQSDILMWRSYVLLLIAEPTQLSRSMDSFRPQSPNYIIKYDASLTGLGVGIHRASDDTLLTFTSLHLPFDVNNESKRQNTMEFIAVVLGLLLAWRYNLRNFHYLLHGDSTSSLAWAKADRVNSFLARRANIVFTTISMHLNALVSDTHHIPGQLNNIYDGLSRHIPPCELGLDPTLMHNATGDMAIIDFITLCDPAQELSDQFSHVTLVQHCKKLLLT